MKQYKMWIAGKWVEAESGRRYPVFNPATEEEIAQVPLGGKDDVDKAVDAARKAFPLWSEKPQSDRSQIAMKIATLLRENAKELGMIDTLDHGTPLLRAIPKSAGTAEWFEWAAYNSRSLMGNTVPSGPNELAYLQREPIGVVALITPWNLPLLMIIQKLAPALILGNTCIIKPPSIDSLQALKLAELLDTLGLPPGTVNVITGPGSTVGEALASHRGVDMVAFTGSCETGKTIMALASQTVKRLQLELGGKNPVIILDDADVGAAVSAMMMFQFANSGQICAAPGRFFVHEKVYDEFLEKVTVSAKKIVVGDPMDEKTQMGPLVSAEHRDKVEGYIKSGIDEGAKLVFGGKRPTFPPMNKGYYVTPTIFTNVTQTMKIGREEIFGPVVCVMEKFNSDDKVIEMANDTTFGLTSYVWTKDNARAMRFANKIAAGTVVLNNAGSGGAELPWGGYKESGIGKEGSLYGLYEYTNLKRIQVDLMTPKKQM
jgi:acyl-CoA reductase-like NAD-dependent aldehyde dehydrogenase